MLKNDNFLGLIIIFLQCDFLLFLLFTFTHNFSLFNSFLEHNLKVILSLILCLNTYIYDLIPEMFKIYRNFYYTIGYFSIQIFHQSCEIILRLKMSFWWKRTCVDAHTLTHSHKPVNFFVRSKNFCPPMYFPPNIEWNWFKNFLLL